MRGYSPSSRTLGSCCGRSPKWRVSTLRELLVAQLLNTLFLENGLPYTTVVVELGAGLPDRLPGWWREAASPLAAFDIAVYGP